MRPTDPGFAAAFAAALDRYLTPPDAPVHAAPCACCRIESTDLDAHGLCPSCVEPDEDDLAELLAGSPEPDRDAAIAGTLCEECGRHMADARAEICSCCAASWWTPGVTVPRADHEGPRPVVFDVAAALAGTVAA